MKKVGAFSVFNMLIYYIINNSFIQKLLIW